MSTYKWGTELSSFLVERELLLLNAEAIIQSELYDIAENKVSQLGDAIGEEYALDLKHWIMTSGALGHSAEPVDPQEYLKEIAEEDNLIQVKKKTNKSAEFGIIKKKAY